MALTKISTGGVKDDIVTSAKIADDAITSALIADDGVVQAAIADEAVDEARLQISNAGSNGQFLSKQSGDTGGLTWATPPDTNTQVGAATGVDFDDDVKVRLGTGNDLEIYHSGDVSRIRNTNDSGTLKIQATSNGENALNIVPNGTVEIYHDGSKKLETTATGVTVSGSVTDDKGNLRSIPYSGNSGAYTLVAADAGKVIGADTSWTIPASTFSAGDAITLLNLGGTALGLTASALTYLWNTANGDNVKANTLTLGARSMATVYFKSANEAFIQASKLNVS